MVNVGLAIGVVGAILLAIGAGRFLLSPSNATASAQRWWTLLGAACMGIGFLAQLAGKVT